MGGGTPRPLITGGANAPQPPGNGAAKASLPGRIGAAYRAGRCLYQVISAKPKVTKTKTGALKHWQEPYNPNDLKHDPHCGFVELDASVLVSSAS